MENAKHRESRSGITWWGGGWVLGLAGLLLAAVLLWRGSDMIAGRGERAVGDGRDPVTYGFDLHRLKVPRGTIAASGLPRDGLPVLDFPKLMTPSQADSLRQGGHYKFLVSGDRVIGVSLRGRARAYPISMLNWHEVVNDTLGGFPIAVTYSPLCDAAVVVDRRPLRCLVGPSGGPAPDPAGPAAGADAGFPELLFGYSGLLCNSNLLLYDRRAGHRKESLWSQLQARAVAGAAAAAGMCLEVLPCVLVRWTDWRTRHPETTVLEPEPSRRERYQRDPYVHDYGSDQLRYPVEPLPPAGLGLKTPCVIIEADRQVTVYPFPLIAARAGPAGIWETGQGRTALRFTVKAPPQTVWVETAEGAEAGVIYSFWYAWFASHPDTSLLGGR